MNTVPDITRLPLDRDGLITHADAVATGHRELLRSLHRAGALERVAAGVYGVPPEDRSTGPQADAARYRRRVLATARSRPGRVFTSYSAAALLRLPIVGRWPEDIYMLSGGTTGSRRPGVREIAHRPGVAVVRVGGIWITAPAFTLIQLARHASLPAALVAADRAVRVRPWDKADKPLTSVAALREEHARLRPYCGSRRVEAVLDRTTHLADGALETLSRLLIEELGFPEPELQTKFWLPELERYAWVDFYWPEYNIAGEADGHGKYLDGGNAPGAAQRVIEEKAREDGLRAQVRRVARWDWQDAWAVQPLGRKLERAGLPRTRPQRRLFVL